MSGRTAKEKKTIRERVKQKMIDCAEVNITLDGVIYTLHLRDAWEVAEEMNCSLKDLMNLR